MYKDLRDKPKLNIIINIKKFIRLIGGCNTIYKFEDEGGTQYYFGLRNGYARIICKDTDEVICSSKMNGFVGVCDWVEMVNWALKNGVKINY